MSAMRLFVILLLCPLLLRAVSASVCSLSVVAANNSLPPQSFVAPQYSAPLSFGSLVVHSTVNQFAITSTLTSNDTFRLSSATTTNGATTVWFAKPVRLANFIAVNFSFAVTATASNATNSQAEGFAVIFADSAASLSSSQGSGSLNIGYNIAGMRSLAVEFDMRYDGATNDPAPLNGQAQPTSATDMRVITWKCTAVSAAAVTDQRSRIVSRRRPQRLCRRFLPITHSCKDNIK